VPEVREHHREPLVAAQPAKARCALLEQRHRAVVVADRGSDRPEVAEPARDSLLVAEAPPALEHLLVARLREGEVAAAERDRARDGERLRTERRPAVAVVRERRVEPALRLDEVAADLPEDAQSAREPQREVERALERPRQRGAHVVVLGLEPVEPRHGVAAGEQVALRLLGEFDEPLGMAAAHTVPVRVGRVEEVERVAAHGLEHRVAGAAAAVDRLPLDEAVVDERQAENCAACGCYASAHLKNPQAPPDESNPIVRWVLNKGRPGLDAVGDSVAIQPDGSHRHITIQVTAKPGTTLYFLCAVHPWMQGKIVVT
jgi:hypothetical protein